MNIRMSIISLLPIYLKMESAVQDTERSRTIYLTLNNIIPMIKQRMISWTDHVQRREWSDGKQYSTKPQVGEEDKEAVAR